MPSQSGDHMTAPGAPDLEPLARALVLAGADDVGSLCVLRERFADLHPWPNESAAAEVEAVVRESVGLIDRLILGEIGDADATLNALGRAASRLAELAAGDESDEPDRAEGEMAAAQDTVASDAGGALDDAGGALDDALGALDDAFGGALDEAPAGEADEAGGEPADAAAHVPNRRSGQPDRRASGGGRRADDVPASRPLEDDGELLAEFIERSLEYLESADELLLGLQEDPTDSEAIDAVFRAFHTIKGMAGFLALQDIQDAAHDSESILGDVRSGDVVLDDDRLDALFAAVDDVRDLVEDASARGGAGETAAIEAAERSAAAAKRGTTRGTVRVDEERLDRLVDTIGELVIAQAGVGEFAKERAGVHDAFTVQLAHLDKISRQLQEMATSMRMVTLRSTMRRMARLVRDLAHDSGKKIACVLEGDDIELDKSIVDGLGDPLLHLVRNAVDHGIEADGEERLRTAKPETATVTISARHLGGNIVIEVSDDGRGLNHEAIVRKAREAGLLGADETPPDEAIPALVFQPGFSTATEVTEISGRGVGMDVVKKAVDTLRGSVSMSSAPGQGTTVRLTLPLTLAIIDGMVVRVASQRYVIPALSIMRTLSPDPSDITLVLGSKLALSTDEAIVPLVRLRRLFELEEAEPDDPDRLVTLVSDGSTTVGLVLSDLIGQQQIVIKSLSTGYGDVPGVSGAAVMPDGRVGLILDVHGIIRLAQDGAGTRVEPTPGPS